MTHTIALLPLVGTFAENKDKAREIRLTQIMPYLEKGEVITLDFAGVEDATQSFIHALISDLIRTYQNEFFENIFFKNCSETIKKIINIVTDYTNEGI